MKIMQRSVFVSMERVKGHLRVLGSNHLKARWIIVLEAFEVKLQLRMLQEQLATALSGV